MTMPAEDQQHRTFGATTTAPRQSGGTGGGSAPPPPSTPAATGLADGDYTSDEDTRFNGLPGKPEVWRNDDTGGVFMVYFPPGFDPPIPLLFGVENMEILQSYFGEQDIVFDKHLTSESLLAAGAVNFGVTSNLMLSTGDPWVGFRAKMDRAAEVMPWLSDPEIFGIVAGAYLEGREPEEWEFATTDWWQSHTEDERAWLRLAAGDPSTAAQQKNSNYAYVADLFAQRGIDVADELINYLADQYTFGLWNDEMLGEQIRNVLGIDSILPMDEGLAAFMANGEFTIGDPTRYTNTIRDLHNKWLGPVYAPTDTSVSDWALRIGDDPAALDELTDFLRNQRMALYPNYSENLTYEDIAAPWRSYYANIWGSTPNETDDVFQTIIKLNDSTEAGRLLRQKGLSEGNGKVHQDALTGLMGQTSQVRAAF